MTSTMGTVLNGAFEEARRRGDRKTGTDHLLLGLLLDPETSRALGFTLEEGRAALTDLDRAALAIIGLDVRGFTLPSPVPPKRTKLTRNTLTVGTRDVLARAVKLNGGKHRGLKPHHLLRAVLTCAPPEPAVAMLAHLGVDPAAVQDRLA